MREEIYNILSINEKVYSAYFFGSFETGEFNDDSDIDIAIVGELDLLERLTLEQELEEKTLREVDVVDMNELPKYLQLQILVRNDRIVLNNEVKHFDYLDTMDMWYRNDFEFWKKSMIERGHTFD